MSKERSDRVSILQDYENIRKSMGEKEHQKIEEYLSENKNLYLSDIYYNEQENNKFQLWKKRKEEDNLKKEVKDVKRATAKDTNLKRDEFARAQNIRISRVGKICLETFKKKKEEEESLSTTTYRNYKKPNKSNLEKVKKAGYTVEIKQGGNNMSDKKESYAKEIKKELKQIINGKSFGGFEAINENTAQIAKRYLLDKGYEVELSENGNGVHIEFYSTKKNFKKNYESRGGR